jgi:antitoxin CptB
MSELKYLRWQCRRGAKELDVFLCAYLEEAYSHAGKEEQAQFVALLKLEDNLLLAYFFSHEIPHRTEIIPIVEKIRANIIR